MTARVCIVALIALLGALAARQPLAVEADGIEDLVGRLDTRVAIVRTGGYWNSASTSGIFRIVVIRTGHEHSSTRAFAQWLTAGQSGELIEVSTVPIAEVNSMILAIVTDVQFRKAAALSDNQIVLTLIHRYQPGTKCVQLVMGELGSYLAQQGVCE